MRRPTLYRIAILLPIVASALVSQPRPIAAQSIAETEAPTLTAEGRPRPSPWRDGWYLEQQRPSAGDRPVAALETVSTTPPPTPRLVPWRDAWYLEEEFSSTRAAAPLPGSTPLDVSLRTHDDWPLDQASAAALRQP